jgi:pilus assembly protein TadC
MSQLKQEPSLLECPICHEPISHTHGHTHGRITPTVTATAVLRLRPPSIFSRGGAYRRFSGLAEFSVEKFRLREKIARACMYIAPEGYAGKAMVYTIFAVPMSIGLAIIAAFLGGLIFLLLAAAPLGVYFAAMYYPSSAAASRKEKIEDELAFFSTYMAMVVSSGISIYNAIKRIAITANPLPASKRESLHIMRDAEIFLRDPDLALIEMSAIHPSSNFGGYIAAFLHVLRIGGDLIRHLDDAADTALQALSEKWRHYQEHAMTVATLTTVFYNLLPITIYVFVLVVASAAAYNIGMAYTFVVMPLGAVAISFLIEAGRPKTPQTFTEYYKIVLYSIPVAIIAGIITFELIPQLPYVAVGIGLLTAMIPGTIKFEYDYKRNTALQRNLPRFVGDMTVSLRVGQPLLKAIASVAWANRYGKALDKVVDTIAWNITVLNRDITEAIDFPAIKDWHTKIIFYLLHEAINTGGGTPTIFERLRRFTERFSIIQAEVRNGLKGYLALYYVTSITIVAATIFITQYVVGTGTSATSLTFTGSLNVAPDKNAVQALSVLILTGAIINSFLLGLTGGKMERGTFAAGFIHAALSVTIALVTIIVMKSTPILPPTPSLGGS